MTTQMTHNEYMWYRSEIYTLERLLGRLPPDRVVMRIGYEERLERAREKLEGVIPPPRPKKLEVSFTGEPVQSHHGIDANFAAESMAIISDAIRLATAGATGELKPTGQIPRNTMGQPIITGVILGSFGLEMELPIPEGNPHGFSYPEQAVERIQALLTSAKEASDEQLYIAAMDIHPRAVNKVAGLLDLMRKRDAQLAMQYQDSKVELTSSEDIERVAKRLNPTNVEDRTRQVTGTIIGMIPATRQFEMALLNELGLFEEQSIQGRVAPDIENLYHTARDFTNQRVSATIRTITIGRGAPRHTLVNVFELTTM